MEVVLVIFGFCVLGTLATTWGVDSRARLQSDEERLASYGMAWRDGAC
jgi:hypothetical protein